MGSEKVSQVFSSVRYILGEEHTPSEPKKEYKSFFLVNKKRELSVGRKRWRDGSFFDFILLLYLKSSINFQIPCMQNKIALTGRKRELTEGFK